MENEPKKILMKLKELNEKMEILSIKLEEGLQKLIKETSYEK